jgi:hypothetical protein
MVSLMRGFEAHDELLGGGKGEAVALQVRLG